MLHLPSRFRSTCAAVLLATALGGAASAFAAAPVSELIGAQLPAGVTLSNAKLAQTATALHKAALKNPELAARLTDAAIQIEGKKKYGLSCPGWKALVEASTTAAPDQSREIMESAVALRPECGDLLGDGTLGFGFVAGADGYGAGLGIGFAGGGGLVGSPPSGSTTFPPVVTPPLTITTNN